MIGNGKKKQEGRLNATMWMRGFFIQIEQHVGFGCTNVRFVMALLGSQVAVTALQHSSPCSGRSWLKDMHFASVVENDAVEVINAVKN